MSPAGRPVSRPRLSAIDPEKLADGVESLALDHLSSYVLRLSVSSGERVQLPDSAPDLRHAVRTLAGYARGEHGLDAPVPEYLQSIAEPLWIRPIDGPGYSTPEFDAALGGDLDSLDDDAVGQLILVMVGATARERLDQGGRLTVAQLAALASISPDHVRLLGREERIRLDERDGALSISAVNARKYLESKKS